MDSRPPTACHQKRAKKSCTYITTSKTSQKKLERNRNLRNKRKFPLPEYPSRLLMRVRRNFLTCPTCQFFSGTPKIRATKANQERGLCWDEPPPLTYFAVSDPSSQVNPGTNGSNTALRRKTTRAECKSLCVPLRFLVRQENHILLEDQTTTPLLYYLSYRKRTNGAAQD